MGSEKIDHQMVENSEDGSPLSRSVTVTMSSEQYEKMFFQPSAPRQSELAKKFANPTLLGLLGFLIPYTNTIFILCGFQGTVAPTSLIGLNGDYYFIGVGIMGIAGIMEFILGNTFPMAVFLIYGFHWGSLAYMQDPFYSQISAFAKVGGAEGAEWNGSQGLHNVSMCLVSFVFLIATLRVNVFFVLTFFGLVMLFAFLAAADFYTPHITTAAEGAHAMLLLRIGGGFGFLGVVCGWYLAIITACAAVGIPCPLPVFDLSGKIFPNKLDKGI